MAICEKAPFVTSMNPWNPRHRLVVSKSVRSDLDVAYRRAKFARAVWR